jgi:hypothetical protein
MQDQVELFEAPEARDPRLRRLYAYWQEKCGDRLFPDRADIDPVDFPYILGLVTIVDIVDIDLPVANVAPHSPASHDLVSGSSAPGISGVPSFISDSAPPGASAAQPSRRYYFRLDGTRLVELSGVDYTGRYLDELPWPDYVDFIRWTYNETLRKKRPFGYRRNGNIDEHSFDEETLIFPLGCGRGQIEKLMVAVIPGEVDPVVTPVIL